MRAPFRLLPLLAVLALCIAPARAEVKTPAQLKSDVTANFPNNTNVRISVFRGFFNDLIDSLNSQVTVANNAALSAISTASITNVVRTGYAAGGDAPSVRYSASGSACSLNAGAGDGGSQVPSSNSKCWILSPPSVLDVRIWGAFGNSTGTTGNGTDVTVPLQNALNYSAGAPYFPCGVYRITATLNGVDGQIYRIKGDGACAQIFNDAASATITLSLNNTSPCPTGRIPCAAIDGLTFSTPTHITTGNVAIYANNQQGFRLTNSIVYGNRLGLVLTASYAPRIVDSSFYNNSASAIFTNDATLNGGSIESNKFFANGLGTNDAAVIADTTNGGFRLVNNDFEGNYAGALFNGGQTAAVIQSNYLEGSTGYDLFFNGTNKALKLHGNRLGSGLTATLTMQQSDVSGNVIDGAGGVITVSAANNVHDNIAAGGTSLVTNATAPSSCGTSPSVSTRSTDVSGLVTTGSTSTTSCTIAFAGTYASAPDCTVSPIGAANSGLYATPSTSGIVFTYSAATSLKISYKCSFSQ